MAKLIPKLKPVARFMKLAFVVLGMHRSGTSSLAGLLAHLGATPPRTLMGPKPENPKGFWESEVIMAFNEEILVRAQSSWDDAEPLDPSVFEGPEGESLRQRAGEKLREEFGDAQTIILKDPRICRFYPFWKQVLMDQGYNPFPIIPIRAPAEVAASLNGRNGMPIHEALDLWKRHVLDAEEATRGTPRHIMMWQDLLTDWKQALSRLEASLDLPTAKTKLETQAEAENFVEPGLSRHYGKALPPADADSLALYERMKDLANS